MNRYLEFTRNKVSDHTGLWISCLSLLLLAIPAHAQPQRPCFLELPVYDPLGNRLQFRVTRVSPDDKPTLNLLTLRPKDIAANEDRVLFSDHSLLGRILLVTLETAKGITITQSLPLFQCPQRLSLRYGESTTGADTRAEIIRGRAVGCAFIGDWWIRAMPTFGASVFPTALEGYIDSSGSFSLTGQMHGERHLVIIGKGKEPVRVFSADVTSGKVNDLGIVDLTGRCPK